MQLSDDDKLMLDGGAGEAARRAMEGLVQLGTAFGAKRMVSIGYAHIHAGMALYLNDVELVEDFATCGARARVPTSSNIANVDTVNSSLTGAPEALVRLQMRSRSAHTSMGSSPTFTCTPYWAGFWPTWNTHMTSVESTVTIFCNSVLGARSNRDGYFAVYASVTGRYPEFGYHCDTNRRGTHLIKIDAHPAQISDWSVLGYRIGQTVGDGVPVLTGTFQRPNLDELDALGAGMATSGGVSMFILPGVTPPFSTVDDAFYGPRPTALLVTDDDLREVYDYFCTSDDDQFDLVHLGCPHASLEEMKEYARLLEGRRVASGVELWVTTSRAVRDQSADAVVTIERAGGKVVSDTCPISCHFARTTSPDASLEIQAPPIRRIVVDSAKQAKYVRDMIHCDTLLTGAAEAVESAVLGRFVWRSL